MLPLELFEPVKEQLFLYNWKYADRLMKTETEFKELYSFLNVVQIIM